MSTSIATDAEKWVKEAAGQTAGLTIKGQLRKAAQALGYRDGHWRIRAAWYGEAECWSAKALRDLEARYRAWEARQASLAAANDKTHAALLMAGAAVLERSHEAMDRQEAFGMRDQAQRLVAGDPGHHAG